MITIGFNRSTILLFAVLLLICHSANSAPCPQLCQTCTANTCTSCYQDWTVDADVSSNLVCGCPQGYYLNSTTRICNFCPVQCISCTNFTTCQQCLSGYKLINGACTSNFVNSTIQFGFDLTNTAISQYLANGFQFIGTAATSSINNYFSYCGSMAHQPLIGKYAFDYDSVVYRTYYALPYHQWAQLKFQFFVIDQWDNQELIVEIEGGRNNNPSTFDSTFYSQSFVYSESIRSSDFCGQPQFKDNLGIFNKSFIHTDSILKFRIKTSLQGVQFDQLPSNYANIYFGIRQVLLIVGLCPSNCLTCASRTLCSSCTELYTLSGDFECICDQTIAYLTENGHCIKKCQQDLQFYNDNKCQPCGQLIPGCLECTERSEAEIMNSNQNYKCTRCSQGKFMHKGVCVNICPQQYFQSFAPSDNPEQFCQQCPDGCLYCEYNDYYSNFPENSLEQVCSSCLSGYIWHNGTCLRQCPLGTFFDGQAGTCTKCRQGCQNCSSELKCNSCYTNTTSSQIFYINRDGKCYLACLATGLPYNSLIGCPNTTCDTDCPTCFGPQNNQCLSCNDPLLLQNYSCVSSCDNGYYHYIGTNICKQCPSQCKTCTFTQCSECKNGYWLLHGRCVRTCPISYYEATLHNHFQCLQCQDPQCNICTQLHMDITANRNTLSQCQQCKLGYFFDTTTWTCTPERPPCPQRFSFSSLVKDCVSCPTHCLSCTLSLCLLCENGYFLNNGVCVQFCPSNKIAAIQIQRDVNGVTETFYKCIWSDPLCQIYTDANCTQCIHLSPSLILYSDPVTGQASCIFSCPDGFSRQSELSPICNVTCPTNCIECDNQAQCTKCISGYFISGSGCVNACPDYYISDSISCLKCDVNCVKCQQDGRCVQCRSGLVLSTTGNCISPSCSISQYNSTLTNCAPCTSPCLTCTSRPTQCTSCISTMYLVMLNFTCSPTCPEGSFADAVTNTCRPCRSTCKSCLNFQNCTKCITEYYLFNFSSKATYCLSECPPGTYIELIPTPKCAACKFPCSSCFGPNSYQCLKCLSGYKMDYTTCVSTCPTGKYEDEYGHCDFCHPTCKMCFGPADFQCISCFNEQESSDNGYYFQGKCYKDNCPSSTYERQDKNCSQCQDNCIQCSSSSTCHVCAPSTILFNGNCISLCPTNTFFNNISNTCQLCSSYNSSCLECTNSGCTRCTSSLYRYDRYCVSLCPVGTYAVDHNLKQCLPCPQSCVNCTSPLMCLACKGKFRLRNGLCLQRCTSGYYYNLLARQCRSCSINKCAGCYYNISSSTLTNCTYCEPGYILNFNSQGVQQCTSQPNNTCASLYFFSSITKQCESCLPSCLTCVGYSSNCTQCRTGLVLVNGLCISDNHPPSCVNNCSLCANTTTCILCSLPYYLWTERGQCVEDCPQGYVSYMRQCLRCSEGCSQCTQLYNSCDSCKTGFYLLQSSCLRQCPDGYFVSSIQPMQCFKCSDFIDGCSICANATSCQLCLPDYTLLQSMSKCFKRPMCPLTYFYFYEAQGCFECQSSCIQCYNQQICIICELGYTLVNGSCINSTYNCPFGMYRSITSVIINSIDYRTISNQCLKCSPPCLSCTNSESCTSCLTGYALSNSTCVLQCPISTYKNAASVPTCQPCSQQCLACRTNSTTCTLCYTNFYLYNKKCVANCPIGMFESSSEGICRACSSYCIQCQQVSACQVCYDGMWLMAGQCISECPKGYAATMMQFVSTLFNKMIGVCQSCQYPCSTCNKTTSQYECQSCQNGFYLYQSRCVVSCPNGFFANPMTMQCNPCAPWCTTCTSYESCQTCLNNQCLQPCELLPSGSCANCQTVCKYCDKSTIIMNGTTRLGTCLQCLQPYLLYAGTCVLSCPTAMYYEPVFKKCISCNCPSCDSEGKCKSCSSTAYLYLGQCYLTCPTGTIASTVVENGLTKKICIINPCISTSSTSGCSWCLNPYYLSNNQCILTCPNGTYISTSSNICQKCPTQCKICSSYNNCSSCNSGFYLQEGNMGTNYICVAECIAGTYINTTNNISSCVDCIIYLPGCRLCLDYDSCLVCSIGFNLLYNSTVNSTTCVQNCPVGFFSSGDSCSPCLDSTCRTCSFSSLTGYKCQSCISSMYFIASLGKCVPKCLGGYYPVNASNSLSCVECQSNCQNCSASNKCIQCSLDYVYDTVTNQCVKNCPFGTYPFLNSTTSTLYCYLCSTITSCIDCLVDSSLVTRCIKCSQGTYLFAGQCLSVCPPMYFKSGSQCRKCSSPCLECNSATNCTKCYSGSTLNPSAGSCTSACSQPTHYYQILTQTCQLCSSQCKSCFGPRFDQCLSCDQPFVLTNSTCIIECSNGQIPNLAGICVNCDPSCSKCLGTGSADECTACPPGTYFYMAIAIVPPAGKCVKYCPATTYANYITGKCISCLSDVPLCSQCQLSMSELVPKCKKCQAGSIPVVLNNQLICKPSDYVCPPSQMYVNELNQCVLCPSPCVECIINSTSQFQCHRCANGYAWLSGQCILSCPLGTSKFLIDNYAYNSAVLTNLDICLPCLQSNCLQCKIQDSNTTTCLKCASTFILYNNNCVISCPDPTLSLTFNQNTLIWECKNRSEVVETCQSKGLFMFVNSTGQTVCLDVCPTSYFPNISSFECQKCNAGCATCTDSINCVTCLAGFYRLNGTLCLSSCPADYININGICSKCLSPCSTCAISLSSCRSCISGYYLLQNSQCVQACPSGYFINSTSCSPCNPKCLTCSTSESNCLSCVNSQYTAPSCSDQFNICLSNQYKTSTSCSNCSQSCGTCYGPADYQCLSCSGSYLLVNGKCITSCMSGYFSYTNPSTSQLECRQCSASISNCATCSSSSSCTLCTAPYILSPTSNACVISCQSFNTATTVYSVSASNPNQCTACTSGCSLCVKGICLQCADGLYLTSSLQCSNNCGIGYFKSYGECSACGTNCQVCSDGLYCVRCAVGYVILNGNCVSNCGYGLYPLMTTRVLQSVNYNWNWCTPCNSTLSNCLNCSSGTSLNCNQCSPTYLLSSGNCNQCQTSYFYQSSTKTCIPCNSTCLTCSNKQTCDSCSSGLLLDSNGICYVVCPDGKYPQSGQCQFCQTNCKKCVASSGCSQCTNGYFLISTSIISSINYTGPSCTQICPSQTTPSLFQCQQCNTPQCSVCSTISSCQKCVNGFYLTSDGKCLSICPAGTAPTVIPFGSDFCQPCKTACLNCSININNCLQCVQGLIDSGDGSCIYDGGNRSCITGQYVVKLDPLQCGACYSSCLQCMGSASSQCLNCKPGFTFFNGYCSSSCLSTQYYDLFTSQCEPCDSSCKTCINDANHCTSCFSTNFLTTSNTCESNCPASTYKSNLQCKQCPTQCNTCTGQSYCIDCLSSATILYKNICYTDCPTGTYVVSTPGALYHSCNPCQTRCLSCVDYNHCSSCTEGYFLDLANSACVNVCPEGYYPDDSINRCQSCEANCEICTTVDSCSRCDTSTVLYLQNCQSDCPFTTFEVTRNGYRYCDNCSSNCHRCTDQNNCEQCLNTFILIHDYANSGIYCVTNCPSGYFLSIDQNGQNYCQSSNCQNCSLCVSGRCQQCSPDWFLINNACTQECGSTYYQSTSNWKCQSCMENCLLCPNSTFCQQCVEGYNFSISLDSKCISEAIFMYGPIANISGFTSNITQITSLVYLSTSAGPVFFGQMSSTYFNIQFCQFMFFHDGVAGNNSQMKTFLSSLSFMSMSSLGSTSSSGTSSRRMLLATESLSFLQINLPIFIMMGCFLTLYILTLLMVRNIDSMCLSCPNLNFYVKEICIYLSNRFKWIYFDFVVWLSYLPFLYFSLMQVQKFNFNSGLEGFSSIFSVIVLITYPLYPVLIAYNIKKNYVAICMQNDKMVEMSLSPWVYKVKRPQFIPSQGQAFQYCSKDNFILLYYPLKYFRKFIFVLVVVLCPNPITTLIVLLCLNVVFLFYMGVLRPRQMPYMVFDFIIEGVMLAFQIFMVVYMALDSVKISIMSIIAHAFGFISANLSIIVAIVLNIVAYYKIFMCIYELYQHLKQKIQQKEKLEAKQKDEVNEELQNTGKKPSINQFIANSEFLFDQKQLDKRKKKSDEQMTEQQIKLENLNKPERDIANLLSDKDLLVNNIQPRYEGDVGGDDNFRGLFDDKELYGNDRNGNKYQVYAEDQLPTMKTGKNKKQKGKQKQRRKQKDKEGKLQKKPKIENKLEETTDGMLREQKEKWNQEQNYSAERLSIAENKNGYSIGQLQSHRVQLRQRNKTIGTKKEASKPNNRQETVGDLNLYNRNKNSKDNGNQQQVVQNISTFSNNKSGDGLLPDSPDKLIETNRIQIREGKYEDRRNKKQTPIDNGFDDFDEAEYVDKKHPRKNNIINEQEYQEGINYLDKKIKRDDRNINDLQQKGGVKKGKEQFDTRYWEGGNAKLGKNNGANQKIKSIQKQIREANLMQKIKEQIKGDQRGHGKGLQQINTKQRRSKLATRIEDSDQDNVENLKVKERERMKQQSFDNQFVEQGLLASRKPNKNFNRQDDNKPNEIGYNERKRKDLTDHQAFKSKGKGQENLEQAKFNEKKNNKNSQYSLKRRNEEEQADIYNEVQFKQKIRSINQQRPRQTTKDQIQEGLFSQRLKRDKQFNQPKRLIPQQKEVQELATKERNRSSKQKQSDQENNKEEGGFFSNLFGFNRKQEDQERKDKKQKEPQSQPVTSRITRKDQDNFQQSQNPLRAGKKRKEAQNTDKGMKIFRDNDNEQYEEIKRRNKQSMIKPKMNYGTLDYQIPNQFQEDQDYVRPGSRASKIKNKDSGLNMDNRGSDASDSQQYGLSTRKARAANKQKNRASKANLNIKDGLGGVDDSPITRKQKEEEQSAIRRGGKGVLKIQQRQNQQDQQLENIQL